MKKLLQKQHGVIMMETLLTLPVYIVMLAGLFWLGESAMTRISLIDGERYLLWISGNRHNSNNAVIKHIFYFLDETGKITLKASTSSNSNFPTTSSASDWGNITQGQLSGTTKRSEWSWEVAESIRQLNSELSLSETPGKNTENVQGRGGNVMIFSRRAGAAGRNGHSSYAGATNLGSTEYMTIAGSKWGSVIAPSVGSVKAISSYTRDSHFISWSE